LPFLLPLWNPVLVAEQVGTLAAIARGRFIFQCGLGADEARSSPWAPTSSSVPRLEESSARPRPLAGETVSSQGRFVVEHARVSPRQRSRSSTGWRQRVSIDRAARIADGRHSRPHLEKAREQAAWYLEGCAKYGKKPTAVAIRRDIYVGESSAEADLVGKAMVKAGYRGIDPTALVWGSVEEVTEKFRALEALGYTDVIVRHLTNDHAKVLGSLARLAEVRRALR
jgi:alkanesulfonate monooxygenase SsuD/methylene tetrahydromethanopterin reductase-like flavin-dependent oxidoreductase (luciferase family)